MFNSSFHIPSDIAKLFWEYDPNNLDPVKHKQLIITRVLNHGNLDDWRWFLSHYGRNEVKKIISESNPIRPNNLRQESRQLASILLS